MISHRLPGAFDALSIDPFGVALPHAGILSMTASVDLIWPWILTQSPDQARSFPWASAKDSLIAACSAPSPPLAPELSPGPSPRGPQTPWTVLHRTPCHVLGREALPSFPASTPHLIAHRYVTLLILFLGVETGMGHFPPAAGLDFFVTVTESCFHEQTDFLSFGDNFPICLALINGDQRAPYSLVLSNLFLQGCQNPMSVHTALPRPSLHGWV